MTANRDLLDTFVESHDRLDESLMTTIEALTDAAASLKVFGEPDRGAIRQALGASAESMRALECVLEAIAVIVDEDDGSRSDERRRHVLEEVRQREPPISERPAVGAGRARPGDVGTMPQRGAGEEPGTGPGGPPAEAAGDLRRSTATAKLMAPYGIAVNLESDLYRDRVRRPFLLRGFKQTWSEVRFLNEREAGAGLVDRLQQLHAALEDACRSPDADRDADPWSGADRAGVASAAERFDELANLEDEAVAERHREDWLERVERWLETAEAEPDAVAHMTEMLTRFATDVPRQQDARVQTAAQRMMALDGVPDEIVSRLEQALSE
jgi:HPt (histidine-containing phosphotransfer) domain-containing protein